MARYGKHHALKTTLPGIIVAVFFAVMFVLLLFDLWLPIEAYCIFLVVLMAAGIYSWVVHRGIIEYIDEHFPQEDSES